MARPSKKKKKVSRRQRQQATAGVPRPVVPAPISAPGPTPPEPVATTPLTPPTTTPVTASFTTNTRRGPDGIDAELAALEYPAVRADLRRLAMTLLAFAIALAGLSILGNTTQAINQLGHGIFHLWQ